MSQKVALMCSEQRLKSFTSINENVSPSDLVPWIKVVQDNVIQYQIGSTFYFEIMGEILSGTVTPQNQFLLDNYLSYAVLHYALEKLLPWAKYKIYNKSVLSPNSENSDSITLDELKFLQTEARNTAQVYISNCISWIQNHPGDYPTYFSQNPLDGDMPAGQVPYTSGILIPNTPYAYKKRAFGASFMGGWSADPYYCPDGGLSSPIVQTGIGPS
jgi:hypothetical protein